MSHLINDSKPSNETTTLGQRLRRARLKKGLSQTELSEKICYGKQAVSSWENDRTEPNLRVLKLISTHLEIPLIELIED